jgi:peptide deformylase
MIKEINKDIESLSQKSVAFDLTNDADNELLRDMIDTANAHKENCAGLAAIQIGVAKRAILVRMGDTFVPFINPMIIHKSSQTYCANEGCLSLDGTRAVKRHRTVKAMWTDAKGKRHVREFKGFVAQIIQHEVDHCDGILI